MEFGGTTVQSHRHGSTAFVGSTAFHMLFSEGVYGVQGASSVFEDGGRYKGLLNVLC